MPDVLWGFAPWLLLLRRPEPVKARPAPDGAGRFILALTGDRAAEYPPAGANTLTDGAAWRGGVKGAFSPFPAWALTRGFLAGCRGPLLLSGRRSVTPACTFGWID